MGFLLADYHRIAYSIEISREGGEKRLRVKPDLAVFPGASKRRTTHGYPDTNIFGAGCSLEWLE